MINALVMTLTVTLIPDPVTMVTACAAPIFGCFRRNEASELNVSVRDPDGKRQRSEGYSWRCLDLVDVIIVRIINRPFRIAPGLHFANEPCS